MYGILMLQEKVKRERMTDRVASQRDGAGSRAASSTFRRRLIDELSEPFGNSVHQTRSGL